MVTDNSALPGTHTALQYGKVEKGHMHLSWSLSQWRQFQAACVETPVSSPVLSWPGWCVRQSIHYLLTLCFMSWESAGVNRQNTAHTKASESLTILTHSKTVIITYIAFLIVPLPTSDKMYKYSTSLQLIGRFELPVP